MAAALGMWPGVSWVRSEGHIARMERRANSCSRVNSSLLAARRMDARTRKGGGSKTYALYGY